MPARTQSRVPICVAAAAYPRSRSSLPHASAPPPSPAPAPPPRSSASADTPSESSPSTAAARRMSRWWPLITLYMRSAAARRSACAPARSSRPSEPATVASQSDGSFSSAATACIAVRWTHAAQASPLLGEAATKPFTSPGTAGCTAWPRSSLLPPLPPFSAALTRFSRKLRRPGCSAVSPLPSSISAVK